MEKSNGHKLFTRPSDVAYLVAGAFIAALGSTLFYTPGHITGGGATGLSYLIYSTTGLDQGLAMLFINIILFFVGVKFFGIRYGIKALIGSTLLSVFVSVIGIVTHYQGVLSYVDRIDNLLSSIYGGVLLGTGIGLVLKSGCNTGGTDIVSQIICHYSPFALGTVQLFINAIVVSIGGLVNGLESVLFSFIGMYLSSQCVNFVFLGFGTNLAKTLLVFSEKKTEDIAHRVLSELHRGGTVLHGTGVYTEKDRDVLLVIVPNQQLHRMTRIINDEDPSAFVLIMPAHEVLGKGFDSLKKIAEKE